MPKPKRKHPQIIEDDSELTRTLRVIDQENGIRRRGCIAALRSAMRSLFGRT